MTEAAPPLSAKSPDDLLEGIARVLADRSEAQLESFRARVAEILASTPEEVIREALVRFEQTGDEWGYHPPIQLARDLHHALADLSVLPGSELIGALRLAAASASPLIFLSNHLSYADANLFEILLERSGHSAVAQRLTVVAGPKVYSDPFRRLSSLCFGTIKTPQSSARSSGEAVMSAREVARRARQSIQAAETRQKAGDHLLIFVEGSRSRSTSMQHALAAVSRYLDRPTATLVPIGIAGSEDVVRLGDEKLYAAKVQIWIGAPFSGELLLRRCAGRRQLMMDVIGLRIAQLLPAAYRGVYGGAASTLDEARSIAGSL